VAAHDAARVAPLVSSTAEVKGGSLR